MNALENLTPDMIQNELIGLESENSQAVSTVLSYFINAQNALIT